MPPRTRAIPLAVDQMGDEDRDTNATSKFKEVIGKFKLSNNTSIDSKSEMKMQTKIMSTKVVRKRSSPGGSSTSSSKRHRASSSYAPPSKYAHLKGITDAIAPNLL